MDMGFELYHKILDEAVDELRTEEFHELFGTSTARERRPSFTNEDVAIELDVDALLPKSWIPTDTDRYEAYKTLYNATRDADADAVFADLRDRFGALPADAEHLWYAVRLRIAALPTGFVRLRLQHTSLSIELPPESQTTYYETAFQRILSWMADKPNIRFVQHGKRLLLEVELARRDDAINVVSSIAAAILAEEAV
jgi:transcription-repair coupling factor (superfamily II helicase)